MSNTSATSILVVEDNQLLGLSLKDLLIESNYHAKHVDNAQAAEKELEEDSFTLIILDLRLPDRSGEELIKAWGEAYPETSIIIMTAHGDIETAVECMKKGAVDFLTKPVDKELLKKKIETIIEHKTLHWENKHYRELQKRHQQIESDNGIVGNSSALKSLTQLLKDISDNDFSCVLIRGESGTGKGLFAKILHDWGQRREKPFVELNCSAIPSSLAESELFGYKKGAFTDAKEDKLGLVELANGGILFLDEIGDMEPNLQTKLLKIVEDQTVRPIGGTKDVEVNVSVIAATHRDLEKMVKEGTFRADLYYRLNVVPVYIPPLRERPEDLDALFDHFLEQFNKKFQKNIEEITEEAILKMKRYNWPGNVREVRNVMERACLLCKGDVLTGEHLYLPEKFFSLEGQGDDNGGVSTEMSISPESVADESSNIDGGENMSPCSKKVFTLKEAEKNTIKNAMESAHGNKNMAARLLGIHRTTLYKKLEELELNV